MAVEGDLEPRLSLRSATLLFGAVPQHAKLSREDRQELKAFAHHLVEEVTGAPFSCLLTNDKELQRLNRTFLGEDYPTDVLSFPLGAGSMDLGEIAISVERAQSQAEEFGHTTRDEVRILMLHGVLHLTGLDHESDSGQMEQAEQKWRAHYNLPSGLIERSTELRETT